MAARGASKTPKSNCTRLCLAFSSCSQKILSLACDFLGHLREKGRGVVVELKNMHQVGSISSLTKRSSWRSGLGRKLTI